MHQIVCTLSNSHKSRPLYNSRCRNQHSFAFRLNYWLSGPEPFYFHIVNVFLHSVVTYLFGHVCRRVFRQTRKASLLAGLLFASHPIHTEAVSGIVGRAELLSCFFFLVAFICYIRCLASHKTSGVLHVTRPCLFLLCLSSSAAAMLCKESGVTVLGVCLAYDVLVLSRKELLRVVKTKSLSPACFPLARRVVIVIVFLVFLLSLRLWVMGGTLPIFLRQDNPASFSESFQTRFLTYSFLLAYNGWLLINPSTLCYDWQGGSIPLVESLGDHLNLATVMAMTVVLFLGYVSYMKLKRTTDDVPDPVLVSLILIVLPFLPASNLFFRVGFVLAERVLYIPSLGFCLCVSSGFNQLFSRLKEKRPLSLSAMFLLLLLNAGKTWDQNKVWLSREALFKSGVSRMPHNAKVHYNYANYLKDTGKDLELAREHYRTAIRLNPEYISAYNNLGTILDNDTEAESHFRTVLDKAPSHPGAHVNLGNILFKRGDHETGLRLLYKALEIDNSYLDALLSLGKAHTELENFVEAEKYLQKAEDIAPENVQVYSHYGALMSKTGDHKKALFYYQKVLRMDQHHGETLVNAAVVYKQLGNTGQAESLLKQAVAIKRDSSSLEQLATFFFHSGRPQESLRLYEEIETKAPNTTDMLVRYGNVLGSLNKLDKAESIFLRVLRQDDQNIDALLGLSLLQSRRENYHQSIEYLSSAIEISKADRKTERLKQLYFERGNNYKDLNLLSEALEDYIRTLELDPGHVKAHGNVGTIYHIWGDLDKAKTHYEAVLRIDPNNSIVRENLQKLNRIRH